MNFNFDIEKFHDNEEILKNYENIKNNNISDNYLYHNNERAAIIGVRSEQLTNGAKLMIPIPKIQTTLEFFAERELDQRKTPFILKRVEGSHVDYWKIEDLR